MRSILLFFPIFIIISSRYGNAQEQSQTKAIQGRYIAISSKNPAYFAYSDGTPYVPIGINMINPSGRYMNQPDSAFAEIETWMKNLSQNGGNYIRVWLSNSF